MHGLINRAIQDFVRDSFGDATWAKVARQAGLEPPSFEPMLSYDDQITEQVIAASSGILSRRPSDVLEDIGHYLVTHERLAPLRRLLRFGGVDFVDFLHTLDDLPDWARLAVDDLILPPITLIEESPGAWRLELRGAPRGAGHAAVGMLRAMADDYGALALVTYRGWQDGREIIDIQALDMGHAAARDFRLAAGE
jgi:hypothetical protein